jgi:hypothetical protein
MSLVSVAFQISPVCILLAIILTCVFMFSIICVHNCCGGSLFPVIPNSYLCRSFQAVYDGLRCHVVMFILPEVHLPVPEILVIVSSGCPLKRGGCIKAGFNCSLVTCPRKRSLRLNMSSKQRWLFLIRGN